MSLNKVKTEVQNLITVLFLVTLLIAHSAVGHLFQFYNIYSLKQILILSDKNSNQFTLLGFTWYCTHTELHLLS